MIPLNMFHIDGSTYMVPHNIFTVMNLCIIECGCTIYNYLLITLYLLFNQFFQMNSHFIYLYTVNDLISILTALTTILLLVAYAYGIILLFYGLVFNRFAIIYIQFTSRVYAMKIKRVLIEQTILYNSIINKCYTYIIHYIGLCFSRNHAMYTVSVPR